MDNNFVEKIKDSMFVSTEDIASSRDYIILRLGLVEIDGVKADAIVRLDVQCYVHPSDGSNLVRIIADSEGKLPRNFAQLKLEGWYP